MTFFKKLAANYQIEAKTFKQVDPKGKTFAQWMDATGITLTAMMIQWGLEEADLMHRYGIEESEEASEEIEVAFAREVGKKYGWWTSKYNSLRFPLTLYRAVCVPKLEDIKLNALGTDWSDNLESAQCYHSHLAKKGSSAFVIKAKVKRSDIDWTGTLWNNLNEAFGEDEQEINLLKGKTVQVVEIINPKDEIIPIGKPGKV